MQRIARKWPRSARRPGGFLVRKYRMRHESALAAKFSPKLTG
jgi:hypothetical protein